MELEEAKLEIQTVLEAPEQDQGQQGQEPRRLKRACTEEPLAGRQASDKEIAERFSSCVPATRLATECGLSARHIRDIASKWV
eukprot:798441-Rhodomonas_salina.1